MASKKLYHRRQVAESDAKACWICFKPSATVLVTPDNDDWFHICAGHLKDRKFAIPQDAEDLAKKKREEEIEKEMEALTKEHEEKQAKKQQDRGWKWFGKDEKKELKKEDEKDDKEKDEKLKDLEKKKDETTKSTHGPRIFELHKDFQQMRAQKKREAEQRKRMADISRKNMETLRSAGAFPQVPSDLP